MRGKMKFVSFHAISPEAKMNSAEMHAYDKGHFITKSGSLFFHGYKYKIYDNTERRVLVIPNSLEIRD